MSDPKDIYVDKRAVVGSALAGLVVVSVAGFCLYNNANGSGKLAGNFQFLPPVMAGPPVAGAPATPAQPGTPAAPAAAPAGGAAKLPPHQTSTSFDDAPASWPSGSGGGGGGAAPAAPAPAAAGPLDKLPPIRRGIKPSDRSDPFVSWRIPKYEAPPAFSIAVPLRIASAYKVPPPPIGSTLGPDDLYGPLPPVERRVAGVLYDGSVSAILETGTPGSASTDVSVVMPGQTVASGIPGIESLTVAAITATGITLRAADGRTVDVKLSNVPAAYADAFHNANTGPQQPGAGGPPGAPPSGPPPAGAGPRHGRFGQSN